MKFNFGNNISNNIVLRVYYAGVVILKILAVHIVFVFKSVLTPEVSVRAYLGLLCIES